MINFMSGCNLLHASVTSGLFFLVFLLRKKTLLSRWYFSDFVLFLFFFSCILHQQWVVSSLLSGHQPQLSSQYTQERSSWSRTCAGSPSRSQCAKHSTCSHHSSYKNKQRPVEERGPAGKLTFKKPFTLTLCLSVFPPYLVALVCFKCLFFPDSYCCVQIFSLFNLPSSTIYTHQMDFSGFSGFSCSMKLMTCQYILDICVCDIADRSMSVAPPTHWLHALNNVSCHWDSEVTAILAANICASLCPLPFCPGISLSSVLGLRLEVLQPNPQQSKWSSAPSPRCTLLSYIVEVRESGRAACFDKKWIMDYGCTLRLLISARG